MEKLYIIKYKHIMSGTRTYNSTPIVSNDEAREHYFTESEKGDFIKKYLELKEAWYCYDLKTYVTESIKEIDIDSILNF
jgi:hypothetical protein